jgi:hypothetical protein
MKRVVLTVAAIVTAILVLGVGGCALIVSGYENAFEKTSDGDASSKVLAQFGEPSVREHPGAPFLRYATSECASPCAIRLWWEHPVLRGMEAWSVELDSSGRAVHKAHWVSP